MSGQRERRHRLDVVEDDAFAGQPIDRGRRHADESVRRQPVGPGRIERDHHQT